MRQLETGYPKLKVTVNARAAHEIRSKTELELSEKLQVDKQIRHGRIARREIVQPVCQKDIAQQVQPMSAAEGLLMRLLPSLPLRGMFAIWDAQTSLSEDRLTAKRHSCCRQRPMRLLGAPTLADVT